MNISLLDFLSPDFISKTLYEIKGLNSKGIVNSNINLKVYYLDGIKRGKVFIEPIWKLIEKLNLYFNTPIETTNNWFANSYSDYDSNDNNSDNDNVNNSDNSSDNNSDNYSDDIDYRDDFYDRIVEKYKSEILYTYNNILKEFIEFINTDYVINNYIYLDDIIYDFYSDYYTPNLFNIKVSSAIDEIGFDISDSLGDSIEYLRDYVEEVVKEIIKRFPNILENFKLS